MGINDPELGILEPNSFIAAAEHAGLITRIDTWVLNEACRQFSEWRPEGLDAVQVAISISRIDLAQHVSETLSRWGVPPGALQIEPTESAAMSAGTASVQALESLKALGVSQALDDFGTGAFSHSDVRYHRGGAGAAHAGGS